MLEQSDPRRPVTGEGAEYYYRRPLSARELLPAVGVGVGVGLVAFYLAKLLFERTPLVPTSAGAGSRTVLRRADSRGTVSAADRR
jgi:hypothetical protein